MSGAKPPRGRAGRAFDVALSLYGAAIFTILWLGLVVGFATGGAILEDAWAWLTGLGQPAAVVAWILLLPIAVGLWAYASFDSPLVLGLVVVGLGAWTLVAVAGLVRTFGRRSSSG